MSKDLTRYQRGIVNRYYENHESIQSNRLSEMLSDLWMEENPKKQAQLWEKAQSALLRLGVAVDKVAAVVETRDLEALGKLIQQADAGTARGQSAAANAPSPARPAAPSVTRPTQAVPTDEERPTHPRARSMADGRTLAELRTAKQSEDGKDSLESENLKRAMKAFRKKLKSLRLDDESRLGGRYTSGGRKSGIQAITPPTDFPMAVWEKLAEQNRLRKNGPGLYELTEMG